MGSETMISHHVSVLTIKVIIKHDPPKNDEGTKVRVEGFFDNLDLSLAVHSHEAESPSM